MKEITDFSFLFIEYKRSRQEIKRKSLDTIKLQKKARKGELLLPFYEIMKYYTTTLTSLLMNSAWLQFPFLCQWFTLKQCYLV